MDDTTLEELARMMETIIVWEMEDRYIVFTSREKLEEFSGEIEI